MPASVGTARAQLMAPPPGVVVLRSDSLVAWVLPYGARLMQLFWLKAPEGVRPLSLGFADPNSYRTDSMSIGAVCGRYANRIAGARIQRGTTAYILDANHPLGHCIHGGRAGWGQRDWQLGQYDAASVELMLDSADGDMGFPGRCQVRVQYRLQGARLQWQADVSVDRECPINLVQHSYWNLDASPNLKGHRLQVQADTYHPADEQELPLPARPVAGTCFDFREAAPISDACVAHLDGAMVLRSGKVDLQLVARLQAGGLVMQLRTDRPLLHVYASANLGASATPLGVAHGPGAALCLETEDMPNGPALGSDVWYGPTRDYSHTMAFDFSTAN